MGKNKQNKKQKSSQGPKVPFHDQPSQVPEISNSSDAGFIVVKNQAGRIVFLLLDFFLGRENGYFIFRKRLFLGKGWGCSNL